MSNPQIPVDLGALKRAPQQDNRDKYGKGKGEIDRDGFSQSHKGYGRGGPKQPVVTQTPAAVARWVEDKE